MIDPIQLHALADGELAPKEAAALRDALRKDPQAATEVDAVLNLKDFLAKNATAYSSDEAWKGCVRRLDALDKTRRVEGFVGRYAWALCGFMFVFILSGRYAMRNVQGETLRTADITQAFRGGERLSPQDQARMNLYGQLLKSVSGQINPKEVEIGSPTAFAVNGFPAARFPMRDRHGDMTAIEVGGDLNVQDSSPLASDPNMAAGVFEGKNCLVWHANGHTLFLTGDRSLEELGEVASALASR